MADGDPYPQKIPRPATARPGRPAPWPTGLVDPAVFSEAELLTALERVGQIGPPPLGVTKSISPRFGELDAAMLDEISSTSAVLIALFEEAGTLRVILTRRAGHLRAHRGEVSFPGGRIEAGEGIVEAAGRE
ncbi:MAG: NUDIX domain-containing protein, partial [Actinomycetota bacterium]